MPPMTDNQRESAIRAKKQQLRDKYPGLPERDVRRLAEDAVDSRSHLRGRYAR
jgi:hypothetical protein